MCIRDRSALAPLLLSSDVMGVAVSIKQIVKSFGHLRALDDVSLEIAEGEFFGLLGPNGAGKTTLISCLAGLVRPDRGQLSVMGCDVPVSYTHLRAHETVLDLVCRLLLEKKNKSTYKYANETLHYTF